MKFIEHNVGRNIPLVLLTVKHEGDDFSYKVGNNYEILEKNTSDYNYDYMNYSSQASIVKKLNKEKIIFSDRVTKINEKDVKQERILVITSVHIYNIKVDYLKNEVIA